MRQRIFFLLFGLLILVAPSVARPAFDKANFQHPRLFFSPEKADQVRARQQSPYVAQLLKHLKWAGQRADSLLAEEPIEHNTSYHQNILVKAGRYFFSGQESLAHRSYEQIVLAVPFTRGASAFQNSSGLKNATTLRNIAIAYDLCYPAWSKTQIAEVNRLLFRLMEQVSGTMGHAANYSLASNWMGIRYSSVLLASLALDDLEADGQTRPRQRSFEWDATHRLRDHLKLNFYQDGWNVESMGYHTYNMKFVGPALAALFHKDPEEPQLRLPAFAPNMLGTPHALATGTVPIPFYNPPTQQPSQCMQPDFADDDPQSSGINFFTHLAAFPDSLRPYTRWCAENFFNPKRNHHRTGISVLALLFYQPSQQTKNPEEAGWQTYVDKEYGTLLFRNRFQNENDILFAWAAHAEMRHGHRGPDVNGWRLMGLNNLWAIGAGRTGDFRGQTNLMRDTSKSQVGVFKVSENNLGQMLEYHFLKEGKGGSGTMKGSCLGVKGHSRKVTLRYQPQRYGAPMVLLMEEQSENGRFWRQNTPGWNRVKELKNGYLLTGPQGQTCRVLFPLQRQTKLHQQAFRFGGSTRRLNYGLVMGKARTSRCKLLDTPTKDGNLVAVITLQPRGAQHPEVEVEQGQVLVNDYPLTHLAD